jgi:hypothetical protein
MALGVTQPLMEMSSKDLPGGKARPAYEAYNLTAVCEPIVWKMLTISQPRLVTGTVFLYFVSHFLYHNFICVFLCCWLFNEALISDEVGTNWKQIVSA